MRRILLVVSVVALMVLITVVMAVPAFAKGSRCGAQTSEEAKTLGGVGEISKLRYPKSGLVTAEFCNPAD
jgi:hypothetical protein